MFSKVNHNFCKCLFLSILLLTAVGCTAIESAQIEKPLPAAASEDLSAPNTAGSDAAKPEQVAESKADEPVEVEPLNLALDIDVQTAASVLHRDDVFLLDVREISEHEAGHIAGNTLIPTGSVAERLAEIPKDKEVIVYCHSGARSARVTQYLTQQGYTNVHNMLGGIVAWQRAGLAVEQ